MAFLFQFFFSLFHDTSFSIFFSSMASFSIFLEGIRLGENFREHTHRHQQNYLDLAFRIRPLSEGLPQKIWKVITGQLCQRDWVCLRGVKATKRQKRQIQTNLLVSVSLFSFTIFFLFHSISFSIFFFSSISFSIFSLPWDLLFDLFSLSCYLFFDFFFSSIFLHVMFFFFYMMYTALHRALSLHSSSLLYFFPFFDCGSLQLWLALDRDNLFLLFKILNVVFTFLYLFPLNFSLSLSLSLFPLKGFFPLFLSLFRSLSFFRLPFLESLPLFTCTLPFRVFFFLSFSVPSLIQSSNHFLCFGHRLIISKNYLGSFFLSLFFCASVYFSLRKFPPWTQSSSCFSRTFTIFSHLAPRW